MKLKPYIWEISFYGLLAILPPQWYVHGVLHWNDDADLHNLVEACRGHDTLSSVLTNILSFVYFLVDLLKIDKLSSFSASYDISYLGLILELLGYLLGTMLTGIPRVFFINDWVGSLHILMHIPTQFVSSKNLHVLIFLNWWI